MDYYVEYRIDHEMVDEAITAGDAAWEVEIADQEPLRCSPLLPGSQEWKLGSR
jgi:hypothetical protein